MPPRSRIAIGCVAAVAAAAAVVVVADPFRDDTPDLAAIASGVAATSPRTATATSTPSDVQARTGAPRSSGPEPLTVEAVTAAAPAAGGAYVAAEVAVELSSVCEGAALDLSAATPVYVSLQTADAPLQYLDAALAVYDSAEEAALSYERLEVAIAECPLRRISTPTTVPSATPEAPIQISGRTIDVAISGHPATQWVQLQTVADPETQLRTAVTATLVDNVIVLVSVDQDSETAAADVVEATSLREATLITERLADATATPVETAWSAPAESAPTPAASGTPST